jgi:hypothetical protein
MNKLWFKDTAERAVKTFLQVFGTLMLASVVGASTYLDYVTAARSAVVGAVSAGASVVFSALSAVKVDSVSPASVVAPPRHP